MDEDQPKVSKKKLNKQDDSQKEQKYQVFKELAVSMAENAAKEVKQQYQENQDYIVNASDAIFIRLVNKPADMIPTNVEYAFHPGYVHQIFGDLEDIKGYKDLTIDIYFLGGQLDAFIDINYSEMLENADDIKQKLLPYFTGGFTTDYKVFQEHMKKEATFQPLGIKVDEYEAQKGQIFELYECDHLFPGFDEYKLKMQILILFEIELANYTDPNDHWKYQLLYKRSKEGFYILAGITNKYIFNIDVNKTRQRISQVMVLPPFRRQGHGLKMLDYQYGEMLNDPNCLQITVEDSSTDFQPLRDLKDSQLIIEKKVFSWVQDIQNGSITNVKQLESITLSKKQQLAIQKEVKITVKQIKRIFNILLLGKINMMCNPVFESYKNRLIKTLKEEQEPQKQKVPLIIFNGKRKVVDISNIILSKNKLDNIDTQLENIIKDMLMDYKSVLKKLGMLA